MRLFVEIDGKNVPLDQCDWVMWASCGCPVGVTVGRLSPTEEAAWKEFYPSKRERDRKRRLGLRMELVTHERWRTEIAEAMKGPCPHSLNSEAVSS